MTLDDFKVGDRLIITSRSRHGEERRVSYVSTINYKGNGLVAHEGNFSATGLNGLEFDADGRTPLLPAGAGAFDPAEVGAKPFGWYVAVEKANR